MKPMEPIEGDKKLGHLLHIFGVLTFILALIGFLIFFLPNIWVDWTSTGEIFEPIELLLFGIVLVFIGRFIMRPMEISDKKMKLGIKMFTIGVITLILSLISIGIDTVNFIIFLISVGIPIYGILLIQKAMIGVTDIIKEVKEETKEWGKERVLIELKDTKKKYVAYRGIGITIFLIGVGCFGGLIPSLFFNNIQYGFLIAGIIIIFFSFPFFVLYSKGHQKYNILKGIVDQKEEPQISQTSEYLDELERLKELLDKDIITKEEFEAKKKQLLGL